MLLPIVSVKAPLETVASKFNIALSSATVL